jgi:hypothetical protein
LPASFGTQVAAFLNNDAAVEQVEHPRRIVDTLEKSAKTARAQEKIPPSSTLKKASLYVKHFLCLPPP